MGATDRNPAKPHRALQQGARELTATTDLVRRQTQRRCAAAPQNGRDRAQLLAAIGYLDIAASALANFADHCSRLSPDPE